MSLRDKMRVVGENWSSEKVVVQIKADPSLSKSQVMSFAAGKYPRYKSDRAATLKKNEAGLWVFERIL